MFGGPIFAAGCPLSRTSFINTTSIRNFLSRTCGHSMGDSEFRDLIRSHIANEIGDSTLRLRYTESSHPEP
jgi:hypothetical protein